MTHRIIYNIIAATVYAISVAAFFLCGSGATRNLIMWIPVATLSVACALLCRGSLRYTATAAFALSALGDFFGGKGVFVLQLTSFAVAHLLFATSFVLCAEWSRRRAPLVGLPVVAAIVMGLAVIPHVAAGEIWMIVLYEAVITTMCCCSVFVSGRLWWVALLGAMLFMASDSVIAVNRFVGSVPNSRIIIMSSYYAAQAILATVFVGRPRRAIMS